MLQAFNNKGYSLAQPLCVAVVNDGVTTLPCDPDDQRQIFFSAGTTCQQLSNQGTSLQLALTAGGVAVGETGGCFFSYPAVQDPSLTGTLFSGSRYMIYNNGVGVTTALPIGLNTIKASDPATWYNPAPAPTWSWWIWIVLIIAVVVLLLALAANAQARKA